MAKMLKVNIRLRQLHLAHYDIRDFGAERLMENLLDNLTLTHLDLSRSEFSSNTRLSILK